MRPYFVFEHAFVHAEPSRRGWALGGSLLGQVALVAALVILPLLAHYEIPLHALQSSLVFLAPPPPPAPPPPSQVKIEPTQPRRYEEILRQPAKVPEKVALVEDTPRLTALSAASMGVAGGVVGGSSGSTSLLPFVPPPPVAKPIVVGGRIQAARILERVQPVYPLEAIEQSISGTVRLKAIIARDGTIKQLELERGHPMLAPAAIEAVRQWRYKPTVLNGNAVEVQTVVDVIFNLVAPPEEQPDPKERQRRRRR